MIKFKPLSLATTNTLLRVFEKGPYVMDFMESRVFRSAPHYYNEAYRNCLNKVETKKGETK